MVKNERQSTMQQLETFEDFIHILHKSSHPSYAIKSEHKCYFGQVLFGDCFSIISISTDCLFFLFNSHRRSVCEFFSSSGIFLVSVHQKYLKAHKIVAEFTYSVYLRTVKGNSCSK